MGFFEGRNLSIEYRWANSRVAELEELIDDLVRRQVAAIVVPGATAAALVAKAATTKIPIVFAVGGDPVRAGLVASCSPRG
jgi:putative ABC transport system substrate-binding protein